MKTLKHICEGLLSGDLMSTMDDNITIPPIPLLKSPYTNLIIKRHNEKLMTSQLAKKVSDSFDKIKSQMGLIGEEVSKRLFGVSNLKAFDEMMLNVKWSVEEYNDVISAHPRMVIAVDIMREILDSRTIGQIIPNSSIDKSNSITHSGNCTTIIADIYKTIDYDALNDEVQNIVNNIAVRNKKYRIESSVQAIQNGKEGILKIQIFDK